MSDLNEHRVVARIRAWIKHKRRQNTTWLDSRRAITVCIVCEPSRPTLVFVSLRWAWRGADTHSLWTEPSCGLKMKDRDKHLWPGRWMTEFIAKCWNRQWRNRHVDIGINLRRGSCKPCFGIKLNFRIHSWFIWPALFDKRLLCRSQGQGLRINRRCCWHGACRLTKGARCGRAERKAKEKVLFVFCDIQESNLSTFHFKIIPWRQHKCLQHDSCWKVQEQSSGLVSQIDSQLHQNSDSCVLLVVMSFLRYPDEFCPWSLYPSPYIIRLEGKVPLGKFLVWKAQLESESGRSSAIKQRCAAPELSVAAKPEANSLRMKICLWSACQLALLSLCCVLMAGKPLVLFRACVYAFCCETVKQWKCCWTLSRVTKPVNIP